MILCHRELDKVFIREQIRFLSRVMDLIYNRNIFSSVARTALIGSRMRKKHG
jgi:hypothetical protein